MTTYWLLCKQEPVQCLHKKESRNILEDYNFYKNEAKDE